MKSFRREAVRLSLTLAAAVAATFSLALAQPAGAQTAAPATVSALASPFISWYRQKRASTESYLAARGTQNGPPHYIDFYFPPAPKTLGAPTAEEARVAAATKQLNDEYFPSNDPSSYFGTFFESGHPYIETVHGPYQWNSHEASGIDKPAVFEEAVRKLTTSGLKSIRIGPNLHQIDPADPKSWEPFLGMIETIWKYGATPTVSIAFFPSLKRWQVLLPNGEKGDDGTGVDYTKSYLLNPTWPADMGKLAHQFMTLALQRAARFEKANPGRKARIAINPINEPETLAGFNREFWHGAHAPAGSIENMRFYVPSIIAIGKANVAIRRAVERAAQGRRILFMHNEAMTPFYYSSHHGFGRFAVSKFMLGDDVLLKADLGSIAAAPLEQLKARLEAGERAGTLNEVDWAVKEFVFGKWNDSSAKQQQARTELLAQLGQLTAAHRRLRVETGKTMRTDNTLHLDYYYQTEYQLPDQPTELAHKLAANGGEKLKTALGTKDDAVFLATLREAMRDLEQSTPGLGTFEAEVKSRADTDFENLLVKEDFAALEFLMGVRSNHTLRTDARFTERQRLAGLEPGEFYRTDSLLLKLSANDGAQLATVLGISPGADAALQLRAELARAAADTSDGGPSVQLASSDSIREVLSKNERVILRRLLGIKKDRMLGFEPQHYARQMRAGMRLGFSHFFAEYVANLRIFAVGVGESGTPYYVFAPLLHDQVAMEYAALVDRGLYATQYDFGPAVSTRGWGKGPLSLHYIDDHDLNPSGMFNVDLEPSNGKRFDVHLNGNDATKTYWLPNFLRPALDSIKQNLH